MWIGTCDGLNIFDGTTPRLYKPANSRIGFSGNIIGNIMETEEDVLWIQTNYGLDRFDSHQQTIQSFKEFKDINKMTKSATGDVYIIKDDGNIYYFNRRDNEFRKLDVGTVVFENVLQIVADSSDILWIFSSDGSNQSYAIEKEKDEIKLSPHNHFNHPKKLLWASAENNLLYFIDSTYAFYEYDLNSQKKYYIVDLESEIHQRGEVSSIIKKQNDYYIGFKSSGLIQLKYQPDQKIKYIIQPTDIRTGIFCLLKDKFQDIIWIGTDGQGLYMYFADTFSIKNTLLNTPAYQINNPVRALYLDDEQTLWIGTKGNGILRMFNYHPEAETDISLKTEQLLTNNSTLTDNSVYCFAPSHWKRLWIGTENGINYYSYPDRKIKQFPVLAEGKTVKYVHSICEQNDSTLWIATVGEGIVKVSLNGSGSSPTVKSAERIILDKGKRASNYFFVSFQESDSVMWFGNRGYGAYRINTHTGQMKTYLFDQAIKSQTVNDIFAILKNDAGYWFGTSFGLTRIYNDDYYIYNETNGFLNNTIHGILEDQKQNLWISTNQGLVRFNIQTNAVQTYHQRNDLKVTEFSDGAYFKDKRTNTLFFGGTNGFITINENNSTAIEYMPALQFNRLSIFGKEYDIYDFFREDKKQKVLELDYSQNFFSLSFIAIDYVNGNNYTYSYKIDGLSENWIENGLSTTAAFSNLSPGQYTLLVKYRSNITGEESTPQSLIIRIIPPWYRTTIAYSIYFILFIGFVSGCIYMFIKRYRHKRDRMIEQMNRQQRNELYESKLRFFTNVTHEFCTPLTLIYGPCQKILSHTEADNYVHKYATMILQNAQKLNALILELIEFRRLETGNKVLEIKQLPISEQTKDIAESFCELAESQKINYQLKIEEDVYWNSDASCFNKIVNNLLSNAFKYTPENGTIIVEQRIEEGQLCIRISNTGKGIAKENLTKIFDRYKILDNFEVQNKNGISPRNGLGLAICHSMVNLLDGQIQVTSVPGQITTFEVTLPALVVTTASVPEESILAEPPVQADNKPVELENIPATYDPSRQTIIIIDDDPSMLWFISDLFAGKYNVLSFDNATKAIEQLELKSADLIISDVMMPDIDGISFAKRVKSNKLLTHIPLILLSALNSVNDQMKGIESGAEAYVTKPFNAEYLIKLAERLILREKELKEYYNSILSTFKLDDGQFLHKENKVFFEKMMQLIDKNITNDELSVEFLSSSLGYSTRHFYRKLKEITEKTPADIIKEYRLAIAKNLLLTTNLSIEEIMDKSGFINRGTFYKIFSQKYNMPPRQYREQQKENFKEVSKKENGLIAPSDGEEENEL